MADTSRHGSECPAAIATNGEGCWHQSIRQGTPQAKLPGLQPDKEDGGHDQDMHQAAEHAADDKGGKGLHDFGTGVVAPEDGRR